MTRGEDPVNFSSDLGPALRKNDPFPSSPQKKTDSEPVLPIGQKTDSETDPAYFFFIFLSKKS